MSRSARLRKYGAVYKQYVTDEREKLLEKNEKGNDRRAEAKAEEKAEQKTVQKVSTKTEKKKREPKVRKKQEPNDYQVFYQLESSKEKYKKMPGKERMKTIAKEWDKKKRQKAVVTKE